MINQFGCEKSLDDLNDAWSEHRKNTVLLYDKEDVCRKKGLENKYTIVLFLYSIYIHVHIWKFIAQGLKWYTPLGSSYLQWSYPWRCEDGPALFYSVSFHDDRIVYNTLVFIHCFGINKRIRPTSGLLGSIHFKQNLWSLQSYMNVDHRHFFFLINEIHYEHKFQPTSWLWKLNTIWANKIFVLVTYLNIWCFPDSSQDVTKNWGTNHSQGLIY